MQEQIKTYRGKAAFHLYELVDMMAPKVIRDLTEQAVALRESAVRAQTKAERDALRFEAEGLFIEARREIRKIYGDTQRGDDLEATADAALSAIVMP
jgi:hypothetical protein